MSPIWTIRTGRLLLVPVSGMDLPELVAIKGDPRVYAVMLGGVRGPARVVDELTEEIAFWGRHGLGMWTVRPLGGGALLGLVGLHERPDGRGFGLRIAFLPEAQGKGLAREAASAVLRFAHDRGVARIVAVARESNTASRTLLGGIGMVECDQFERDGHRMVVFESRGEPHG